MNMISNPIVKVSNGVTAQMDGDYLVIRIDVSEQALARAKPSKSGALCIFASTQWRALKALGGNLRINVSAGIPNPAHDKAALEIERKLADDPNYAAKMLAALAKMGKVSPVASDDETEDAN